MSNWEDLERYPVTKSSDPTVIALLKAISAQETVQIIYNGGSEPGTNRTIRPHAVFTVEGSDYYYLEAYCHTLQEVRCFRVDKIVIPKGSVDWSQRHIASKDDFAQTILQAIKAKPGQKGKDIAAQLGVERKTVNSALYGRLRGEVRQDKRYRWYSKSAFVTEDLEPEHKRLETPLARLCRYYLDCLSHDDLEGVSTFAVSKHGNTDYVEIATLPILDETGTDPFDSDEGRQLLAMIRRDRHRKTIFLGYPVRLNFIRSRRTKWEGFLVEPLLLFPFQEAENKYGTPTLTDNLPQINFRALRSLSNAGDANLMEEAIQLANELGLDATGDDQPNMDELIARLHEIRPDWDWQEDIDPNALSKEPPLSSVDKQGIYNRGILLNIE